MLLRPARANAVAHQSVHAARALAARLCPLSASPSAVSGKRGGRSLRPPWPQLRCAQCRGWGGCCDGKCWACRVPWCWGAAGAVGSPGLPSCCCPRRSWFDGHGLAGKLRAIQTVSCLLQGPAEAGNRALELDGIMESVLSLCASSHEADQLVAVEALIHAADKAKHASFITANGVTLLKEIYKHSERDSIRIRALVVRPRGPGGGKEVAGLVAGESCWCSVPGTGQGSAARLWAKAGLGVQWQGCVRVAGPTGSVSLSWQGSWVRPGVGSCTDRAVSPAPGPDAPLCPGALQAGLCRRHRLQHEAVCRRLHPEAGQAVPQVRAWGWGRLAAGPGSGRGVPRVRAHGCPCAGGCATRRWTQAHGAGRPRGWPTSPSTLMSRRSLWRTRLLCRPCSSWPRCWGAWGRGQGLCCGRRLHT